MIKWLIFNVYLNGQFILNWENKSVGHSILNVIFSVYADIVCYVCMLTFPKKSISS